MPKDLQTTPALALQFEDFRLDSRARLLRKGRQTVRLSPKAFDLLCALVARRPDVLSKNDLLAAIWPDTFVVEANLNVVVAEIRRALGDDPHAPRFIRTVHGVGYAFCGEAVEASPRPRAGCWLSWDGRTFALGPGAHVIGRDPGSAVWLDDESVSRRHARISVEDGVARVEDLGSTNGTFLNRAPLDAPAVLHDGDTVLIGSLALTFRTASNAAARTKRLRRAEGNG